MSLLEGKKALILGVANERSIAWSIAKAFHDEGAELGFTFLGDALERRVRPLAESVGAAIIHPCDVGEDDQIDDLFETVHRTWGGLDVLVHSVAFADRQDLTGSFLDTSRDGFALALDVSAFSLVALARRAAGLMDGRNGTMLTMTYYGAEKVVPGYNVMGVAKAALEACVRYLAEDLGPKGIRINALSAGPIKTLASSGVPGIRSFLAAVPERSPLRRNISGEDVGRAALFLASDLSGGITGETIYVDAGMHIKAM